MSLQPKFEAVERLLNGKIPLGYPNNIFAKQLAGKTLLTLQLMIKYCSKLKNANILVIDVDGGLDLFVHEWTPTFEKLYDWHGKVFIEPGGNLRHVAPNQKYVHFEMKALECFGVIGRAEISEGGKTEFVPKGICKDKVEDYLTNKNVKAIAIDSFSQIFKDAFVSMSSFGARARAEDMLFSLVKSAGLGHRDVLFFCNHHHSQNPMKGTVEMAGGGAVIMNSKIALYIDKMYGNASDYGRIYVYRYPNIPQWGRVEYVHYTPQGFVDSSKEEVEALLKAAKK